MDTPTLVMLASALVLGCGIGALFGYTKGTIDGFKAGCEVNNPQRGPDGRFIKKD